MKKKIINAVITLIIVILATIFGFNYTQEDIDKITNSVDTIIETTTVIAQTKEDEQTLEVQEANMENDEFSEKSEVAYNGSDKTPKVEVGKYKGLTYYSQADTRWASKKYGNNTMINSGCGPTSAAMVVSSIRGEVLPTTMADLFVKYGYRSANSGTYWSSMKFTADVFDIEFKETYSFDTMINKLKNNNYVVAICREGLFTYGGHFIVITGIEGSNLKVYDPYLYSGKFAVSSRKGANVKMEGNTAILSKENFKKYANAQCYFCFKNDRKDVKVNNTTTKTTSSSASSVKSVDYYITTTDDLNIRKGASTSYAKVGLYKKGTKVKITKESGKWGYTSKGWICLTYTKKVATTVTKTVNAKSGLVLRKTAGTSGKKIITIPNGKKVTIVTLNYTTKNGYVWSKVKYGSNTGYVAKKYLK